MAIQPIALGANAPLPNALGSFADGAAQRQQFDSNNIKIAQQGLETIGAIALGSMGGDMKGQADPAKFEQGIDYLVQNGVKQAETFRGRPDLAPMIAQASMTAQAQLANARDEQQYQLALDKFQLDMQQAMAGPKPTANMQDYAMTQQDPGYADFLQGGKKAPAEPALTTIYDANGREQKGYMQDGAFVPVGSPKATTERPEYNVSQAAAAGYADRMVQSNAIISDPKLLSAQTDRGQQIKGGVPVIGNALVSSEYQQADQAKRDFINAILRRESGAIISPSEFDNANKQYFPQPDDDEAVLRQKEANRKNAINGISRQAGPAYTPPDTTNYLSEPAALGGDLPKVGDDAAFDALSSGDHFIDPDGNERIKP